MHSQDKIFKRYCDCLNTFINIQEMFERLISLLRNSVHDRSVVLIPQTHKGAANVILRTLEFTLRKIGFKVNKYMIKHPNMGLGRTLLRYSSLRALGNLYYWHRILKKPDKKELKNAFELINNSNSVIFIGYSPIIHHVINYIKENNLNVKTILYSLNIEHLLWKELIGHFNNFPIIKGMLDDLKYYEIKSWNEVNYIFSVSYEDLEYIRHYLKVNKVTAYLPHIEIDKIYNLPNYKEMENIIMKRSSIDDIIYENKRVHVFVGGDFPPDIYSSNFLIKVFARGFIAERNVLVIIGKAGTLFEKDFRSSKNIIITGYVPDNELVSWLCLSDVMLNPRFYGSWGAIIKNGLYLLFNKPIITTMLGLRGYMEFMFIGNKIIITGNSESEFIKTLATLPTKPYLAFKHQYQEKRMREAYYLWWKGLKHLIKCLYIL